MIGRPKPPPRDAAAKIRERARTRAAAAAPAAETVGALGIVEPGGPLVPLEIRRRTPGPRDVVIDVQYCGMSPADVLAGRGELDGKALPLVPGREIVGIVAQTGAGVTDLGPGTRVGVGALVDSCEECEHCRAGREPFCARAVATYGATDPRTGEYTRGGYSKRIVVDRDFVLRIPAGLDPAAAAPLLGAGIAAYSSLREHRVGPGSTVGVLGPGGAGHLAVRLAEAMGAKASVLAVGSAARDSAPDPGAADDSPDVLIDVGTAVSGRPGDAGSLVGSIAETQELLDFCADHQVACEIELIGAQGINEAWERILAADVHHGFVLDLATLGGNN